MGSFFLVVLAGGLSFEPGAPSPRALHTPDVIAPAVSPYLACLLAARGSQMLNGTTGDLVAVETGSVGSDCTSVRRKASTDALQLLRTKKDLDGPAAEAVVDSTLADMENFATSVTGITPGSPAQPLPAATISLEDEVMPAYKRYFSCLNSSLRREGISSSNATARFARAMGFCRRTRALSVTQAEHALAAKGWPLSDRKRTAKFTFEQTDRQWESIARQVAQSFSQD